MKTGGAKTLWLLTAGLGLVFLLVYAATGDSEVIPRQTPQPVTEATPDQAEQQREQLNQTVIERAKSRVDSRARLEVESVTVQSFTGPDLQKTNPGDPDARLGWVFVLVATVDGRPTSRLTYHAVPPDTVVFVEQQAP